MQQEILNVVERIDEDQITIHSFIVDNTNDETRQACVNKAEKFFIDLVKEFIPDITEEDKEYYLEEGYDDDNGHTITIIWSESFMQ